MQRIVIGFSGDGDNIGTPVQLTVSGRITAVQFNIVGSNSTSGMLQLASSPLFVTPIQQSGLNPQEISAVNFQILNDVTPTQSRAFVTGTTQLLPADYPVTVGEQLFINTTDLNTTVGGTVVVYLS